MNEINEWLANYEKLNNDESEKWFGYRDILKK